MIFDTLAEAPRHFHGAWWREVLSFAASADPNLPPGEIALRGRDLFVKVLDFTTGPVETAVLESHRAYVDVHMVTDGVEDIRIWPTSQLVPRVPHDVSSDVTFWTPAGEVPVTVRLRPGHVVVLEPHDAHMPALMIDAPARVKKLVFKVAIPLLTAELR